jgi:hypothetical protein
MTKHGVVIMNKRQIGVVLAVREHHNEYVKRRVARRKRNLLALFVLPSLLLLMTTPNCDNEKNILAPFLLWKQSVKEGGEVVFCCSFKIQNNMIISFNLYKFK